MMTEKQTTDIKATDNTRQIRPALYLIPSTMSDAPVSDVIPTAISR